MTSPFSFQPANLISTLNPNYHTQYHYSRDVLLEEHNSLLAKVSLFGPHNIPRNQIQIGKIIELKKMEVIEIQELLPNCENINKYIYSTQISQIAECETIRFIIEDENDHACRISIPGNVDTSKLTIGVKLAICNPIYRKAFDGKYTLVNNNISDIYLMREFPSQNSPRPAFLTSTLFPPSLPPSVVLSTFGKQEKSPTQSKLLTSPLKNTDKSGPPFQFEPYHSLSGEAELIGPKSEPEPQQQPQQQPLEEVLHSQCRIDLPQSPEIGHEDVHTLNSTGIKLFEEGRYLEAIVKYTSAIQTRDKVSDYYSNRGMCYFKMEYFEIALADFQKAFSITSNSAKYQYWIALTWSKIGNHKMSLDVLKKIKTTDFFGPVNTLKIKEKSLMDNTDGKFDFDMLRQNVIDSKDNEIGDYIGPIQIRKTPDRAGVG